MTLDSKKSLCIERKEIRMRRMQRVLEQFSLAVMCRRGAKGWSRAELARRSMTTYETIQTIENGVREPKFSTVVCICRAFGCTLEQLVGEKIYGDSERTTAKRKA